MRHDKRLGYLPQWRPKESPPAPSWRSLLWMVLVAWAVVLVSIALIAARWSIGQ